MHPYYNIKRILRYILFDICLFLFFEKVLVNGEVTDGIYTLREENIAVLTVFEQRN